MFNIFFCKFMKKISMCVAISQPRALPEHTHTHTHTHTQKKSKKQFHYFFFRNGKKIVQSLATQQYSLTWHILESAVVHQVPSSGLLGQQSSNTHTRTLLFSLPLWHTHAHIHTLPLSLLVFFSLSLSVFFAYSNCKRSITAAACNRNPFSRVVGIARMSGTFQLTKTRMCNVMESKNGRTLSPQIFIQKGGKNSPPFVFSYRFSFFANLLDKAFLTSSFPFLVRLKNIQDYLGGEDVINLPSCCDKGPFK